MTDAEQEPGSDKAVPGYAVMERQVHFLVKQHRRQQQQVGIKARGPCNSCLVEIASPQQQQAEEWIYCLQKRKQIWIARQGLYRWAASLYTTPIHRNQ